MESSFTTAANGTLTARAEPGGFDILTRDISHKQFVDVAVTFIVTVTVHGAHVWYERVRMMLPGINGLLACWGIFLVVGVTCLALYVETQKNIYFILLEMSCVIHSVIVVNWTAIYPLREFLEGYMPFVTVSAPRVDKEFSPKELFVTVGFTIQGIVAILLGWQYLTTGWEGLWGLPIVSHLLQSFLLVFGVFRVFRVWHVHNGEINMHPYAPWSLGAWAAVSVLSLIASTTLIILSRYAPHFPHLMAQCFICLVHSVAKVLYVNCKRLVVGRPLSATSFRELIRPRDHCRRSDVEGDALREVATPQPAHMVTSARSSSNEEIDLERLDGSTVAGSSRSSGGL